MPKPVSAGMNTHLQQELTTLATCWEIKRRDGVFFRFTDNVENLTVDGATYRADAGYIRSALSNTSDFSVDNLEVDGFFDSIGIEETDLRKGLFDFAQVRIFLVNYNDTTQIVRLRRGYLGEVQSRPSGLFAAELRSLSQSLQQTVGALYQATCRADLGDRQCRFPIQPNVVLRNTAYLAGEYVRAYVNGSSSILAVPVTENGFEALTGWTTVAGDPEIVASAGGLSPFAGSNFLHGNTTASASGFHIQQDVVITGIGGFSQVDLDAGNYYFRASVRIARTADPSRDAARIRANALDANGVILKELWNTKYTIIEEPDTWELFAVFDVQLPAGTTQIRFDVEGGNYPASGVTDVGFDDLQAEIVDNGGSQGSQEFYENRIYEVTTAGTTAGTQPAYDTTVGNTTTDGTAVLTARDAFTRHAVVATVTNNRQFTITWATHPNSVDDWLNGGAVIWETGNNAGFSMEIRDWVQSSSSLTLFLDMQDAIQVGDKLRLFPGCDKRRETCRAKFVIPSSADFANGNMLNFDGEPDVPGPDAVLTYPDA